MFARLDFDEFHRSQVPALLATGRGRLGAAAVATARPIAFRLPDRRAYTFAAIDGDLVVRAGDADAGTIVALDEGAWSDFAQEAHTAYGLLYAGLVTFAAGTFADLERWEPALRAVFDGRPLYDPAAVADLDLGRSFALDDGALASFLHTAGFAHVRGVFAPGEIAALSDEVERLRAGATPDDRRSWWATNADGVEVCCRLIYTSLQSPAIAALASDERLRALADLVDSSLVPTLDRMDGIGVVIKNPAVVEGLSDLPWHRDCGLGGHPVLCPTMNIGIQLDAASADNGQLHFLAGSHESSGGPPAAGTGLPTVAVDTQPGDVTVHFGHVFHAAPPPLSATAGRRALYVGFVAPHLFDVIGPEQGYNDVLFTGRTDGRVASVEERLARTTS